MAEQRNTYDTVDYPGHANTQSHPDNLAVIALLHGLQSPPVDGCRVLEIGCSRGNNIIPMAYAMPGAEFVGIDLAAEPIAYGQRKVDALGLGNIRLIQADLVRLDESFGAFDYIIAHGVYAWVPEPVRDALLARCRKLLAPNGVAFITYNTLPGGHLRRMVREMLLSYAGNTCEDAETVERSLASMQFFVESMHPEDIYRPVLQRELEQMRRKGPDNVFHDELEIGFGPVSFTSFVAHAARHGLQYLGDSAMPGPTDPCFKPNVAEMARQMSGGDRIAEEQMFDFMRMRMYRETLLCHAECTITPDLDLRALARLRLACNASPADAAPSGARVYNLGEGKIVESEHPAVIVILDLLSEAWPRSIPFANLLPVLAHRGIALEADLLARILRLVVSRVIDLHIWQAPIHAEVSSHPHASGWFRLSMTEPHGAATLIHTNAAFTDSLVRDLVLLLDGTRDHAALTQALCALHPAVPQQEIAGGIEAALVMLHRTGLLVDDTIV